MHIGILNEAVVALKLVKVSLYEAWDLISLQHYELMPSDGAPLALLTCLASVWLTLHWYLLFKFILPFVPSVF